MSPAATERRIRDANAIGPNAELPDGAVDAARLLTLIDRRITELEVPEPSPLAPTRRRPRLPRRGWAIAAAVAAAAVLIPVVAATIVVQSGSTEPDVASEPVVDPFASEALPYADFPGGQILHDDDWAVITFLRPPACVPPTINLISPPAGVAPSDCGPVTVNVLGDGSTVEYVGTGDVPVWFVPWPLIQALTADGDLNRRELLNVQSRLEGVASVFSRRAEGGSYEVSATGTLDDGGEFGVSGSAVELALDLSSATHPAGAGDVLGAWENRFQLLDFKADGTVEVTWKRSSGWGFGIPSPAEGAGFDIPAASAYQIENGVLRIIAAVSQSCDHLAGTVAPPGTEDVYFAAIDGRSRLTLDVMSEACTDLAKGFAEPFTRADS